MINLLKNTAGHDAFVRYLSEANIRHLIRCISKMTGNQSLDNDTLVFIRIYCYGTAMTICSWLMGEITCEENDLAALFEQALPSPLKPLLYRE